MNTLCKLLKKLEHFARQFAHLEWAPLLALLGAALLTWAFIELADEVIEGETQSLDQRIVLTMRNSADLTDPLGPPFVEEMGRDFTALGGVGVLASLTAATVLFLLLLPKYRAAAYVSICTLGAVGLSLAMKSAFARPRPELVPHGSHVYTSSFPSGHSMMSAAVYLTLGMLLARLFSKRRLQVFCIAVSVFLTVAVGVSRVYLGVHWPTDVLAGWAIGSAWALLCWYVAGWLQDRGQIEQEVEVRTKDDAKPG